MTTPQTWQPIETAPKDDETLILACISGTRIPMPTGWDDGWYTINNAFKNWHPTHWMPLPSPPATDPSAELQDKKETPQLADRLCALPLVAELQRLRADNKDYAEAHKSALHFLANLKAEREEMVKVAELASERIYEIARGPVHVTLVEILNEIGDSLRASATLPKESAT